MGFKRFTRGFDRPLVVALIGLVIVVTICYLAIAGSRQYGLVIKSLSDTTGEYDRLSSQIDSLKEQAAEDARISAKAAKDAADELEALRKQNRALLNYLRREGIAVPRTLAPRVGGGGGSGPKAPGPRGPKPSQPPASPGPRPDTPSPSPGVLDLACDLVPAFCPLI